MRSRTPDRLCAEAVDLAREAAEEAALPGTVGEHIDAVADGDRVVTHLFACKETGYRGWRWAVTVARASRAKLVTLDETVLLPGPDALLAPEWVPWSERLRPGDMGPGDLLPTEADDLRLEPGFTGEDAPPPNSPVAEGMAADVADSEEADVVPGSPAIQPRPRARQHRGGRRGAGHAPRPGPVPLRPAHRRRPLGRGLRGQDPHGPGGPGHLRVLRLPHPAPRLPGPGVRRLRQRVRPGGRAGGVPRLRLRCALRGRRHAEAAAAGRAGGRRDRRRAVVAAPGAGWRVGRGDGPGRGARPQLTRRRAAPESSDASRVPRGHRLRRGRGCLGGRCPDRRTPLVPGACGASRRRPAPWPAPGTLAALTTAGRGWSVSRGAVAGACRKAGHRPCPDRRRPAPPQTPTSGNGGHLPQARHGGAPATWGDTVGPPTHVKGDGQ